MVAGRQSCSCEVCGTGCSGRFAGCRQVWAAGPKPRPARKRGTRTIPVAATRPMDAGAPLPSPPSTVPAAVNDERLRSINETVDRMGRQLRGVVKLLNQQTAQAAQPVTPAAPVTSATEEARLAALGDTVDRMGRELRGVLNLLIQQQATLAKLTATSPIPTSPIPPSPRNAGAGDIQRSPQSDP